MTTSADYLALLPGASQDKPKFTALLSALLDGFADVQNTMVGMPGAFDIDTAVGPQLDAVGQRVGLSRKLATPIAGVYFSLDTAGLGLDQGVIRGPFDPTDALVSLDDGTYRLLLKLKIQANYWDGSLGQAQTMLAAIQSSGTYLFAQDNFDMSMLIGVSGIVPSTLFVSILKQMSTWIRPAGVSLPSVSVTSVSGNPIFGLDVQNNYVGGLDTGSVAVTY